jgi:transposase-like protein
MMGRQSDATNPEGYIQGISTRSVDDLVKAASMSGIPVSRLCEEIDVKVKAFLDRPIGGDWPYVHEEDSWEAWLDCFLTGVADTANQAFDAATGIVNVFKEGRERITTEMRRS